MTKMKRRLFFLFFITLFIITVPIVTLRSKGYYFDWQERVFVYSGSIAIKSSPKDIEVYLNDKKITNKSATVINNTTVINSLRPGKYKLKCTKPGYTSWEKNIEVHSGISTEFWNVWLFPQKESDMELQKFQLPENLNNFFISPRQKNEVVLFSKENEAAIVSLLNTEDEKLEEIYRSDKFDFLPKDEKENIEWSSDNRSILVPLINKETGEKDYIVAKIKKTELKDPIQLSQFVIKNQTTLSTLISPSVSLKESNKKELAEDKKEEKNEIQFQKARWMFNQRDELVLLTKDHQLLYLDLENPEKSLLLAESVNGFDFAGNRIYYTTLENNLIWEIKDNNIETKRQITANNPGITENNFLELTVFDQYRIAIIDQAKNLYLLNVEKEKQEKSYALLKKGVEAVQFSNDGEKILFWTNNEIFASILREWEVQPTRQKGDEIFLTRFSAPIKNVQWLENYENVLFSNQNKVKVAELDNRDRVNVVDALERKKGDFEEADVLYDKNNRVLYLKKDSEQILEVIKFEKEKNFLGL